MTSTSQYDEEWSAFSSWSNGRGQYDSWDVWQAACAWQREVDARKCLETSPVESPEMYSPPSWEQPYAEACAACADAILSAG